MLCASVSRMVIGLICPSHTLSVFINTVHTELAFVDPLLVSLPPVFSPPFASWRLGVKLAAYPPGLPRCA